MHSFSEIDKFLWNTLKPKRVVEYIGSSVNIFWIDSRFYFFFLFISSVITSELSFANITCICPSRSWCTHLSEITVFYVLFFSIKKKKDKESCVYSRVRSCGIWQLDGWPGACLVPHPDPLRHLLPPCTPFSQLCTHSVPSP